MDGRATGGLALLPRPARPAGENVVHKLHDILVIAICAVICGADGWAEVEKFGNSKLAWFRRSWTCPTASPPTTRSAASSPAWTPTRSSGGSPPGSRPSPGRRAGGWSRSTARPSAAASSTRGTPAAWPTWSARSSTPTGMVFGQVAVGGKGNEIEAIPRLLALLDLDGATVTIDAIGCQREVAREVRDRGGGYVLAVKENQPALHAKVKAPAGRGGAGRLRRHAARVPRADRRRARPGRRYRRHDGGGHNLVPRSASCSHDSTV